MTYIVLNLQPGAVVFMYKTSTKKTVEVLPLPDNTSSEGEASVKQEDLERELSEDKPEPEDSSSSSSSSDELEHLLDSDSSTYIQAI